MIESFRIRNVFRAILSTVMSLCLATHSLLAQEVDQVLQKRVKYLVKQLQSKNEEPDETESGGLHRQSYYKLQDQVPVYLAMHQLLAEGSAACDELVLHLMNGQYSYTYDGRIRYYYSVGQNCGRLFDLIINCYRTELHLISAEQLDLGGYEKDDRAAWWKANRHRPLWEIQVERIDEALALMQKLHNQTAPIGSGVDKLLPETFEKRRQQNILNLKALRQSIELRRDYHVSKTVDDPSHKFIWLPWQEKDTGQKIIGEPLGLQAPEAVDPFRKPQ